MHRKYDETPAPDVHYGRADTPEPELVHPSAKTKAGRDQLRKEGAPVGPLRGDLTTDPEN